jgi:murein DD-endopeptidase MepM/ murein hydrolase activator NlpD
MHRLKETKTKIKLAGIIGLVVILSAGGIYRVSAQNERDRKAQELQQVRSKINDLNKQLAGNRQQQSSLNNEIKTFDTQIQILELQIQANTTESEDTKLQINELQDQINRRQAEINQNKTILSELIVQLHQLDNNSILYMSLGNDNFSAFLDQVQYTESVQGKVFQILQNIKTIKQKLEAQQTDLKAKLAKLEELREQLDITQNELGIQKEQKASLLSQTKNVERNYQRLLTQSQAEEDRLEKEIQDLDNAVRNRLGKRTLKASGVLAYPMDGALTQGYGNTGFRALGYNFHNGIDLAAPAGKPIYAAAAGTVNACDTGEAAYGNWCTVKHSISTKQGERCIVTLYAHMRSFKVRTGQRVAQGDLIGYEGNSGNTTRLLYGAHRGYHLHFTVFDCEGFGISRGQHSATYGSYSVPYGYTYNPMDFLR